MGNERPTGYLSAQAEEALRQASSATLTTQLLKRGFRTTFMAGVLPLRPDLRLVGYAFTLRYIPMREDLDLQPFDNQTNVQRLAIEAVGPGDVLIIDARGDVNAATLGDILATRARVRGCAGIVTDGAFRDAGAMRAIDIPSYSRGAHASMSTTRHHPVDMNVPIGCGGVMVMPGDVIVGDSEGVVVIPSQVAEEVALAALEQDELEAFVLEKVRNGASIRGVYPPDEQTLEEYREYRQRQGGL
jgi:regulator of RNase E activity RraA